MKSRQLELSMSVPFGHEKQAAALLSASTNSEQWKSLVALAAEIVTLQEQHATGQTFLVAPVHRDHLAAVVAARKP